MVQVYVTRVSNRFILHADNIFDNQLRPLFNGHRFRREVDAKQICFRRTGVWPKRLKEKTA